MKKTLALLLVLLASLQATSAFAVQATSFTYTVDDTMTLVRTQDAYLPDKTISSLGLNSPEDLFFDDSGLLYIADTGNKRVLVYDSLREQVVKELAHPDFRTPRGLYVTEEGQLYVADAGAKAVFRFDGDLALDHTFLKPDTAVFADTNYEPMKVAVDKAGSIYIIGEGVYSGVIQLAPTGEFLGYFTVNRSRPSIQQIIQRALFTREQRANLVDVAPGTFSNVFVDKQGIVYTTSMGLELDGLKKHATNGANMFVSPAWGEEDMRDVTVNGEGVIFVSSQRGKVTIYSKAGELVFSFGSNVADLDVSGLYGSLPSIAVSPNGDIWTVDGMKGYLQSYKPTVYANTVYEAMTLYEQGRYKDSLELWNQALRLNQMSVLAHNGVGNALFHEGQYEQSMGHFEVAGNRHYYSEAFWEVRNDWLQKTLPLVAIALIALVLLALLIRRLDKKRHIRGLLRGMWARLAAAPFVGNVLFALTTARHPLDGYYDLRVKKRGSLPAATFLYAAFFVTFILYQTSKGFIYQFVRVQDIDVAGLSAGFFVLLGMFIFCNWLVSSINDGDGTLKQIYMIPAYALLPLLFAMLINLALSYGVTYSESFILSLVEGVGILWSLATLFLGLMTVHDYSFKETVKSLLMTVVFIIIAALVALIFIVMVERLYQFLGTIFQEVKRNVYA